MLKNYSKKFVGLDFFRIFAIPKLEQKAPNQLSFNELGIKKEILKHYRKCYSLKEQNSEGNRKTA